MTSDLDLLSRLRRPRLLVRAARFGLADYMRERDLKRAFPGQPVPSGDRLVSELIEREADCEAQRTNGVAGYSVVRHVHLLTVIMAEARWLMKAAERQPLS